MQITKIQIKDENGFGQVYQELELSFDRIQITVKDLIVERVYQEVVQYNEKQQSSRHSLVKPKTLETTLNGSPKKKHQVDPEKQIEIAFNAFESNGFFILIDDMQAESLDQTIKITANTSISFIKLTQLVGG
ncbi:hypothetical protein J7384_05390 [Endozoicomonas sp. G2_1]|uniref:hypothetical protein n=1 Tax=Endozoicomonas sp. G2_1 TaxID=2821091 RepID=UPI001ADA8E24|nr:hypothetical protein [Endozoicomonas sp. G2_1]MBO9489789.1 hypothetical protein [Endozoicomonas sp. G2_1]